MVLHNVIISTNSECFGEWLAWQRAHVGSVVSLELSIMWHIFHGILHSIIASPSAQGSMVRSMHINSVELVSRAVKSSKSFSSHNTHTYISKHTHTHTLGLCLTAAGTLLLYNAKKVAKKCNFGGGSISNTML